MTSEIIFGFKKQVNVYNNYSPECSNCNGNGCSCFKCSAFTSWPSKCDETNGINDWFYESKSCCFTCPNKPLCSKPNPEEGYIGLSSKKKNPLFKVEWDQKSPNLKYSYYLRDIDTFEQINNWQNIFLPSDERNKISFNNIMINYSSKSIFDIYGNNTNVKCFNDPLTKKPMNFCSILKSNSEIGNFTRNWYNSQPLNIQDQVIEIYCGKNSESSDCKCANRAFDETYSKIKKAMDQFNDSCWYTPCSSGVVNSLLPSDVVNKPCPSSICQQIYNFVNDESINVNDIKESINCNWKGYNPNSNNHNNPENDIIDNHKNSSIKQKYILSSIIFFLFFIIGIIFYKKINFIFIIIFWMYGIIICCCLLFLKQLDY